MSDYLDPENEELLADFFSEAEMQVEALESNILVLEGNPTSKDAIDEIFRAAHTLKGGAATVQMKEMASFTHMVEDAFDLIRSGKLAVDNHIIDILLQSMDVIKAMLEERMAGSVYEEDISELTNSLKGLINSSKGGTSPPVISPSPTKKEEPKVEVAQELLPEKKDRKGVVLSEEILSQIEQQAEPDEPIYRILFELDTEDPMASVNGIQVFTFLRGLGKILLSIPSFDDLMGDGVYPQVEFFMHLDSFLGKEAMEKKFLIGDFVKSCEVSLLGEVEEANSSVTFSSSDDISEEALWHIKEATGKGMKVHKITALLDVEDPMASVGGVQVFSLLKNMSTILKTIPSFDELMTDNVYAKVDYYVHLNDLLNKEDIIKRLSVGGVVQSIEVEEVDLSSVKEPSFNTTSTVIEEKVEDTIEENTFKPEVAKVEVLQEKESLKKDAPVKKQANSNAAVSSNQMIRIENKRIDYLLNLVSETVINKAGINQISSRFSELFENLVRMQDILNSQLESASVSLPSYIQEVGFENWGAIRNKLEEEMSPLSLEIQSTQSQFKDNILQFRALAQSLGRTITDLHESILRIRMVPVSQLFFRFTRVVRDLNKQLSKKVSLNFEGEETELDKSVIDELSDPIMHCVRNSMDHGIEMPDVRLANGKPEEGSILLKASNEGNQIIIEIVDDGKGVDPEIIRNKAIEKGVLSPNKVISDYEAINLIFEPGFSTAAKITDLSGRGVGLDVVKRNIEKLSGTVSLYSELGKGSRFVIRLPLTLAIVQALLVRVRTEIYAIPLNSVLESHRISKHDVKVIDGYEMFDIRDEVISLIRLSDVFNISVVDNRDYYFVIVVGSQERRIGLVVDSLIGEDDVVIKPLKDQYTQTKGIAGATLLGDGQVALILEIAELMDLGLEIGDSLRK